MGLQDVFFGCACPLTASRARTFDAHITEPIYFHALHASMQLARESGSHEAFP